MGSNSKQRILRSVTGMMTIAVWHLMFTGHSYSGTHSFFLHFYAFAN